jgi:hypothetical protein
MKKACLLLLLLAPTGAMAAFAPGWMLRITPKWQRAEPIMLMPANAKISVEPQKRMLPPAQLIRPVYTVTEPSQAPKIIHAQSERDRADPRPVTTMPVADAGDKNQLDEAAGVDWEARRRFMRRTFRATRQQLGKYSR